VYIHAIARFFRSSSVFSFGFLSLSVSRFWVNLTPCDTLFFFASRRVKCFFLWRLTTTMMIMIIFGGLMGDFTEFLQ
jgi:hypothetical protein